MKTFQGSRDIFISLHTNIFIEHLLHAQTSLVAEMVKRLPAMQETRVPSQGREDPLEKETATHSRTLAWEIPWTQSTGLQRVRHD